MWIRRFLATLTVLVLASLPSFAAPLGGVRLGLVEGDVQTRNEESDGWVPAAVNTALAEGDELWVPQGAKAELQLSDGTYLRLDYESALQILRLAPDSYQFFLSQGRAYVRFRARDAGVLQLDTPQASVSAAEPCSFDVELSGDYTDMSAYRGAVDVESPSGRVRLTAGNVLSLGVEGGTETTALGPPDAWEAWNRQRNEDLLRDGPSNRYLPAELRPYGADFDRGGRWVDTRDYGPCWTPADASDADWAPYRSGRWVSRGGDYVWVGYEPWGWAPYHFGRWAFVPPFGWCWVPPPPDAVFWGPGFVGWVRTPDYVGWVPLAPREVYYGRGFYGRYSVDVTRAGPDRIRMDRDYRNGRVRNGFIVVHRTTFLTGAPPPVPFKPEEVRRRIYKKENMIAGRPPIDPVRASFMPIIKAIRPPFLPPPAVEKLRVDTVRRARPMERRRDDSTPRPSFVPLPRPVQPVPAPRRRLEHSPAREPDRGDRGRGDVRPQERGPNGEEPKRPAAVPGRPERGEDRKSPPPAQTPAPQERRLEHWPARRPDGEDRSRGEVRPGDSAPKAEDPRRPGTQPARPAQVEERKPSPPVQGAPPPERRLEQVPARRPDSEDRSRGEVRPGDSAPKAEDPRRPGTQPARPAQVEERKPSPPVQGAPLPERRLEQVPARRPEGEDRSGGEIRLRDRAPRTDDVKRPGPDPATPDASDDKKPARGIRRSPAPDGGGGNVPQAAPRSERGNKPAEGQKAMDPAVPRAEKAEKVGERSDKATPAAEGERLKKGGQRGKDSGDKGDGEKGGGEDSDSKRKGKPQKAKDKDNPPEDAGGKGEPPRGR